MKLIIKNLGSIKNNTQAIDLSKDFLVFVGHNNSGKTYVSQLLWTIYNNDILKKFAYQYSEQFNFDFQAERIEITEELVTKILDQYTLFLQNEILNIFNIDSSNDSSFPISIQFEDKDILSTFQKSSVLCSFVTKINQKIQGCLLKKDENSREISISFHDLPENHSFKQESFVNNINIDFLRMIVEWLVIGESAPYQVYQTFFLPSSRHFYPIFYRYIYEIERKDRDRLITQFSELLKLMESDRNKENLTSELISKSKAKLISQRKALRKPYTEPINQLFEKLYSLNESKIYHTTYLSILQKLQKIMGGEINIGSVEGIAPIEFYLKLGDNKTNLPMHLASSSVGQLTLLYLYFKYWVSPYYNFLIIDEPEENLHPENQIKLLEILIDFATQNNNKVLITTHSLLLADAVNNYIYLDVLKNDLNLDVEKIIEENNLQYLNPSVSLSKDKIGVYFFTGDKIIDYQADDYGVSFSNFREVQNNVDKSARILTDYIYSGGDETEDE